MNLRAAAIEIEAIDGKVMLHCDMIGRPKSQDRKKHHVKSAQRFNVRLWKLKDAMANHHARIAEEAARLDDAMLAEKHIRKQAVMLVSGPWTHHQRLYMEG